MSRGRVPPAAALFEEEEEGEDGERGEGEGEDLEKIELHVERALWSTGHLSASAFPIYSFIFEWSTGHFSACDELEVDAGVDDDEPWSTGHWPDINRKIYVRRREKVIERSKEREIKINN